MGDFVHLHVHSEYSLLDGFGTPQALHARAKAHGQRALAITDHGNTHAAVKHLAADGVAPIVGAEIYVGDSHAHLIVLAKNRSGIRSLNSLITHSNTVGFYKRPTVTRDDLMRWKDGLMILSGCIGSEIGKAIAAGNEHDAESTLTWYRDIFGEDYWLEVQSHGIPLEARVMAWSEKMSKRHGIKIVATQDSHFVDPEDAHTHELLLAIQTHSKWDDPKRWRFEGEGYWLASTQEMESKFPLAWTRETLAVAERVTYTGPERIEDSLPWPHGVPHSADLGAWLGRLAREGYASIYRGEPVPQLAHELAVISQTKYERYFLIVADICRWARSQGIRISARGSAAGSLVAYCLGITPVDPLHFKLSFERFLNEGRTPDIDLDFEDSRRGEVIAYAKKAYGNDYVAPIVTFAQIGGRMAVRDVGRVLGTPLDQVGEICAQIPQGKSIADAIALSDDLRRAQSHDVLRGAQKLEGTIRHAGKHAAGLVIARVPLSETVSLMRDSQGGAPLAAVEMGDIESLGLVKFDVLGLKTLTVVGETLRRIGYTPDFADGDERTYALLGAGNTVGVFQVESPGMRAILRELKPTRIEHLQALVALYRPGPMEHIGAYLRRKNAEEQSEYYSEHFVEVLQDTYGLLVYQEAIMDIAHKVAGMTPYESDQFLGAVRKKDPKKLVIYEPKFKDGLARAGVPQNAINSVWRDILPFANYGFNKAHAACYGTLAYETAWLKAWHAPEFYASLLDAERGDSARVGALVIDARRNGVRVLPPCVNKSELGFAHEPGAVRYGLEGIKYVGQGAIDAIMEARQARPFESLEDFLSRVPKRRCNKRATTMLAFAGAFDELAARRVVLAALGAQGDTLLERLRGERDVIGVSLSRDILEAVDLDGAGRDMMSSQLPEAAEASYAMQVSMGGEVVTKRDIVTKSGRIMTRLQVRDEEGQYDAVLFGDVSERWRNDLAEGKVVLLQGRPNAWRDTTSLSVSQVRLA